MTLRKATGEVFERILSGVRLGIPLDSACWLAGMSPATLNAQLRAAERGYWHGSLTRLADESRQAILEFRERLAEAVAEHGAELSGLILEAARVRDKYGRPDWKAAAWYLEHHPWYRQQWGWKAPIQAGRDEGPDMSALNERQTLSSDEAERLYLEQRPALEAPKG